MTTTANVVRRFLAFKYQPKESKKSKVDRLTKRIRQETGVGRGVAEDIADAIIRGREVDRLAVQKRWPIEDGTLEGPTGKLSIKDLESEV